MRPSRAHTAVLLFYVFSAVLITLQDMLKPYQPQFVLDVEITELFIQAGLQDRVIQVRTASMHGGIQGVVGLIGSTPQGIFYIPKACITGSYCLFNWFVPLV